MSIAEFSSKIPSLVWPANLKDIKFCTSEQDKVETFIRSIWHKVEEKKEGSLNFKKTTLGPIELPVSIAFIYGENGIVASIVLLLNTKKGVVSKRGAQRRPKTCYDLISGKTWVKKREVAHENEICTFLHKHVFKGLPQVLARRENNNKIQFFEIIYPSTLEDWIGKWELKGVCAKLFVIHRLMQGVVNLRRIRASQTMDGIQYTFPTFHNDIKLTNILMRDTGPVLIDFGGSNCIDKVCGSPFFFHPADARHVSLRGKALAEALVKNGQNKDMWCMGLVIATVLRNQFSQDPNAVREKLKLPPLKFVVRSMNFQSRDVSWVALGKLTQAQVDEEILAFKKESRSQINASILEALWDVVLDMLKVDPQKTTKAEEVLAKVKALYIQASPSFRKHFEILLDLNELELQEKEFQMKLKEMRLDLSCKIEALLQKFSSTSTPSSTTEIQV